ncbi:hypothetical protein ACLOJK_029763 [Asimina triloba]
MTSISRGLQDPLYISKSESKEYPMTYSKVGLGFKWELEGNYEEDPLEYLEGEDDEEDSVEYPKGDDKEDPVEYLEEEHDEETKEDFEENLEGDLEENQE